ncbi:class I SAM-dependent methyltransferase [Marivirga sp. S37H4]|uniref:Class I SAM-dependent methyltransferase n=1 Tax=Marivirga aurantiaca TaxID=2802615 RepID=A0A934WZT6_9BACT|nr:class I SAM-dependent methyltransferase [Marivirga aurantiaca]MBK6265867.1 class I SAM-dependent methyltransferase [Marivirga aurantiaca]
MHWKTINKLIGNIDLYWLDFILKGNLEDDAKILDAGCGEGRNLFYCMQTGYDVFGVDQNPEAIMFLKLMAKQFNVTDIDARFQVMDLAKLRFPDESFDVIINSAVLHFAESQTHFMQMLSECVRVLKPDGKLFMRTMADKGLDNSGENNIADNKKRFLLNENLLQHFYNIYGLEFLEIPKYVVVGNVRTMGTFAFKKIKNG